MLETFNQTLHEFDAFCRVDVKKPADDATGKSSVSETVKGFGFERNLTSATGKFVRLPDAEDPLIDVFDEDDHVRILVQCRCREHQVTFHPCSDGIIVCKEECHIGTDGAEACDNTCKKVSLQTDQLQINDMLLIVAKCNNNNTLEAMVPKVKR